MPWIRIQENEVALFESLHSPSPITAFQYYPRTTSEAAFDPHTKFATHRRCTALGFWDTGLKPTLPEHAVEGAAGDIQPG